MVVDISSWVEAWNGFEAISPFHRPCFIWLSFRCPYCSPPTLWLFVLSTIAPSVRQLPGRTRVKEDILVCLATPFGPPSRVYSQPQTPMPLTKHPSPPAPLLPNQVVTCLHLARRSAAMTTRQLLPCKLLLYPQVST